MAARVHHQFAGAGLHVLERDPDAAHVAGREGREVDGVLVRVLLAAEHVTQRLAGLRGLVEDQPETYFKPAFYGASGWVGIILDRPELDWGDVEAWLQRSWRSVAPKRLTRMLDIADEF